ncbi:hypothetical protein D9M73_286100 [compost metagenome]
MSFDGVANQLVQRKSLGALTARNTQRIKYPDTLANAFHFCLEHVEVRTKIIWNLRTAKPIKSLERIFGGPCKFVRNHLNH